MRYFLLFLIAQTSFAAIAPRPIPRTPSKLFMKEGLFEGGTRVSANLEGLRFSKHRKEKTERWVFDFSSAETRVIGKQAPLFQIRYVGGDTVNLPQGKDVLLSPPRLIVTFRAIGQNYLTTDRLKALVRKSDLVKNIILYPPIEDGDMAIEFILKAPVPFEPHQPLQNEGRLVLDLKSRG